MGDTESGGLNQAAAEPAKTSKAGRNLPAAIAVSLLLGGTVIATLIFAPRGWPIAAA